MMNTFDGELEFVMAANMVFSHIGPITKGCQYSVLSRDLGVGGCVYTSLTDRLELAVIYVKQTYQWPSCIAPTTWLFKRGSNWYISENEPDSRYYAIDEVELPKQLNINYPMDCTKLQRPWHMDRLVKKHVQFDYFSLGYSGDGEEIVPYDPRELACDEWHTLATGPAVARQSTGNYVVKTVEEPYKWPPFIKDGMWLYMNQFDVWCMSQKKPKPALGYTFSRDNRWYSDVCVSASWVFGDNVKMPDKPCCIQKTYN